MQLIDAVDSILPYAPGAPSAAAVVAMRNAARDYFNYTMAWRKDFPLVTEVDVGEYVISGDPDEEVFDISTCTLSGQRLSRRTMDQIHGMTFSAGSTSVINVSAPNRVTLYPAPGSGNAPLLIRGIVRPALLAMSIPDDVYTTHQMAIENGALLKLLSQPNQPWTDMNSAAMYGAAFREQMDTWRSRGADDGMTGVRRRVRYGGY